MKKNPNLPVFIIGLLLFSFGVFLIYPPAAAICGGLILMVISLLGRGGKHE